MRRHSFLPSVCVGLLLLAAVPGLAQDAPKKMPVPAEAAQEAATSLVRETYGSEYARAKTPAEKQALAKKLLAKADESKDYSAGQFVLLRLAKDIAAQAGDGQTAFQAIDAAAEAFEVDANEMKSAMLAKLAVTAKGPVQYTFVVDEALNLMEDAVRQDNFTVADELGKVAIAAARKALDKELLAQAQSQVADVAKVAKACEKVKEAAAVLERKPDDPEANLSVGKYRCFLKGDWDKGLPMLALASDAELKALAHQDLQGVASSTEQADLGDGWWSLAEEQKGMAKKHIQGRAVYWYRRALPGLSGVTKDKVEMRVKEVEKHDAEARAVTGLRLQQPSPRTLPVKPQNSLLVVVDDADVFDEKVASQFPAAQNKAGDGVLNVSSRESREGVWDSSKVFSGSRKGDGCNLGEARGFVEATWAKPPMGRYILLFARTESGSGKGSDRWGTAAISVNGGRPAPLFGMACQKVAVIDLGRIASVQRVTISINGEFHPGLAGIEIHEGIPKTKKAIPKGHSAKQDR